MGYALVRMLWSIAFRLRGTRLKPVDDAVQDSRWVRLPCEYRPKQVSNVTEVTRPTQWKPGQSGNLNGRPVGTREAFSAGFLRDLADVRSRLVDSVYERAF